MAVWKLQYTNQKKKTFLWNQGVDADTTRKRTYPAAMETKATSARTRTCSSEAFDQNLIDWLIIIPVSTPWTIAPATLGPTKCAGFLDTFSGKNAIQGEADMNHSEPVLEER